MDATWLQFTKDELLTLVGLLTPYSTSEVAKGINAKALARIEEMNDPVIQARHQAYRDAVDTNDECEVDDDALVSEGDDDGAFVMAWVWVADSDAGLCERCKGPSDDGEGWDGLCGDCADKEEEDQS